MARALVSPARGGVRRRAHRQPRLAAGAEVLGFLRRAVDELGQTIVMVTHDPIAAGYADEVVFLADGRIVDRLDRADRPSACSTA